jgi:hypothetical protein
MPDPARPGSVIADRARPHPAPAAWAPSDPIPPGYPLLDPARPGSGSPDPARPDPTEPDPTPPDLGRLIDDLDGAGTDPDASGAYVARATGDGWSTTARRSLQDLVGWTAPLDCDAIGIVAAGATVRAVPLGRGGSVAGSEAPTIRPPSGLGPAGPIGRDASPTSATGPDCSPAVRLVAAVDRFGRCASRLTVDGTVHHEPPAGGRMLDTLQRCLGRPTRPPDEDTTGLLATLWFAAIMAQPALGEGRLTWTQAIRLHPASQLLLASGTYFTHRELTAGVDAAVRTLTWDVLRDATARRGTLGDLCPASLAAWMDSGIYSRWILGQLPDLETLAPATIAALRPSTARRLVDHVAASLQPGRARPPAQAQAS